MRINSFLFIIAILFCGTLPAQNRVMLDASQAKDTINKNIYGHFAEHLGHCIYGGFYVGDNNKKIPNKNGIRLDVIEALKKLKIPVLRWPGGCFADTYHWKDGIGPRSERPSMLNVWWGNVKEDNSFGTNEFLNMCEVLGAEPYLSGNVGSGTPQELSDWVKYTTHPNGSSPMPELRARYGRPDPWKVKYWGLGNEAWGCGGNMTASHYADVYRQYATFMTNGDGIYRIASGASDDDYNWTEVLMKNLPANLFNALGLHHYSVIDWNKKSSSTDFSEREYFTTMQRALFMEELISKHSAIMDKYDPKKRKSLAVDEWGGWYDVVQGTNGAFLFQQNTMRDAMIAGCTLNIFNNHCDRVKMANLAQIINVLQAVILTDGEKMIVTPTYHVMEMYNVHQDALMLPVTVASNKYILDKDMLDAVSVSASKDKSGAVHISLVNIDARNEQEVKIDLQGLSESTVTGRILRSDKLQDHNTFDDPQKVKPSAFSGASLNGNSLSVKMPPFSVVVLELK
ncbi:alpha-L-arabinofuranosidase C-terminal domain-containing protein [Flavitalea sp. BT771]|uniref:alpha-N-arabinofuranosidase n=1 Tax=Flavitalea sp. BT771 TaxID=3063329 RepID=UPI0026E1C856|nr:alpha-L-arabinofuranosidase C-terminal domain-containing protein [Flavitalea sp. BT771]MDO6430314.1 alpha-L-arabinofuranosidase C-terminal domain-containing protein [Flavitalea sp. BT771]MDV6219546.1 alpha-L-arabinofuranosidase C-terminal domain-containing protein [Flavitalea sp. BT771]